MLVDLAQRSSLGNGPAICADAPPDEAVLAFAGARAGAKM
jgi:hypothetical protein